MKAKRRAGITLFDLLVILAILGFLIGLLLPAVFKVRQAAAHTRTMSQLRQIGIAVHNHQDSMGTFPPGNDKNNFSAAAYLLPFVEAIPEFEKIDFKKPMTDKANAEVRKMQIKLYLSPQDPRERVTDEYGATNFLFCAGAKPALVDNNGAFFQDSKMKLPDDFPDGGRQTMMAGETLKGDGQAEALDVKRKHVLLTEEALKDLTDESGVADFKKNKNIAGDRCASWMDGRFLQGVFTGTRILNDERPDVSCQGAGGLSALRSLTGGANVAMSDASVRHVQLTIKLELWKALATRNGKDTAPRDF